MNKYEFYSKLLQEDFPVKYRQDFAEHDSEQCKKIHHLKVKLAQAVNLLRELDEQWNAHDGEKQFGKLMHSVESFLDMFTQAEQQEC